MFDSVGRSQDPRRAPPSARFGSPVEEAEMPDAKRAPSNGAGERRTSTQRRVLIRDRVVQTGAVRIEDLATEFGVTVMTIHRDLSVLEAEGWLRKVRGGATVDSSAGIDTSVRHRLTVMVE